MKDWLVWLFCGAGLAAFGWAYVAHLAGFLFGHTSSAAFQAGVGLAIGQVIAWCIWMAAWPGKR